VAAPREEIRVSPAHIANDIPFDPRDLKARAVRRRACSQVGGPLRAPPTAPPGRIRLFHALLLPPGRAHLAASDAIVRTTHPEAPQVLSPKEVTRRSSAAAAQRSGGLANILRPLDVRDGAQLLLHRRGYARRCASPARSRTYRTANCLASVLREAKTREMGRRPLSSSPQAKTREMNRRLSVAAACTATCLASVPRPRDRER
jgi:hypothetical protein